MADAAEIVYRIDARDMIVGVDREWDRFAAANHGEECLSGRVVGRPLWDFVSDETTRLLYSDMLARIRAGRRIRFPFRCDCAERRRFMEMDAAPAGGGNVEFRSRTLSIEERAPQGLWDPEAARSKELLRACSWCKRIALGDSWLEVEDAVKELGLFDAAVLPLVTHGVCPGCESTACKAMGLTPGDFT